MHSDLDLLLSELRDRTAEERRRYFQQHDTPPALRDQVEESLRRNDSSAPAADPFLGTRCGPYELVRLLGEGGMGAVYLARRADGEVEQFAAIKFVRGGARLHELFLRERQILASLHHPGIARLLNAGTTPDGRPYLVMEYVDGVPIDTYCAPLNADLRLRLLLPVCEAVGFAHRNLVIHRDLKPANILVDSHGRPHLLDFGIARVLDGSGDPSTGTRRLTPDFASPEQLRGEANTTATDLYSLGAILRVLVSDAPAAPEDLRYVIAMATRPEPAERYPTAEALAADLLALLESRPVKARSGDSWYRTRRFCARHWLSLAASAVLIGSLGAATGISNRQRAIAQERLALVRAGANRMMQLDHEIESLPGSTKAREELVAASTQYLEGLGLNARGDAALEMELADGYLKLAEVQGVPAYPNLGKVDDAARSLRKADTFMDDVLSSRPRDPAALDLAGQIEEGRMMLADTKLNFEESLAQARKCVSRADILLSVHPNQEQRHDAGRLYTNSAIAFQNAHFYDEAARDIQKAIAVAKASGDVRIEANAWSLLANVRRQTGELPGALEAITEARRLIEGYHFSDEITRIGSLYAILWRQGLILGDVESVSLGRSRDAIEPLQQDLDLLETAAAHDPDDAQTRIRIATAARTLGDILAPQDPARAEAVFDRALHALREISVNSRSKREVAKILARSSYALRKSGKPAEATARLSTARTLLTETGDLAAPALSLGREADILLRALADDAAASRNYRQAAAIDQDLLARVMAAQPTPESDLLQAVSLSHLYRDLSAMQSGAGESAAAADLRSRRVALWTAWTSRLPGNDFLRKQLEQSRRE